MGKLVLIRHGRTFFNMEKRFTGFTDVELSPQGEEDAQRVAEALSDEDIAFDAVYTSWLKRSWSTLDIVMAELGQKEVPLIKHPFLNERHYGDLQGIQHEEMAERFGADQVQIWRRSFDVRPPNGESLKDVIHRASYYLENEILPRVKKGENILVCAHGNSNRALVKYLENIADDEIVKLEIAYDVPLIYSFE